MNEKSAFSNRIYIYTFLLSVLVILIHSVNLAESNLGLADMVRYNPVYADPWIRTENFFANVLGEMAVPGFFLVSGYLFFRTLKRPKDILDKWRKRFMSVVFPYGVWCVLYYLAHVLTGETGLSAAGLQDAVAGYTWNPTFWYLYQLILLIALAPVLWLLLRNEFSAWIGLILCLFLVYRETNLPLVNEDALTYYYTGAWLAAFHGRRTEHASLPLGLLLAGLALLLCMAEEAGRILTGNPAVGLWGTVFEGRIGNALLFFFVRANGRALSSHHFTILMWVLRRILLAGAVWFLLPERLPAAPACMKHNFYLYAVHYGIVRGLLLAEGLLMTVAAAEVRGPLSLLLYLLTPAVVVWLSECSGAFLQRFFPVCWRLLSGGR